MKYPIILIIGLTLMLSACARIEPDATAEYLVLAPAKSTRPTDQRIKAFTQLFDQMKVIDLNKQVATTYAEKFYFNDTLVTLHDRTSLLKYFQHTQKQLEAISFKVLSCQGEGNDVTVRWQMHNRFTVMGQTLNIDSIGISHLRFDAENKIILHQDYWDSMQGLYQHLPIIGGLLRWIKNGLYAP